MEDKKPEGEDVNLNSDEKKEEVVETEEEATETKTSFTLEEVEAMKKEMQSNSEKGVQKIISEKKVFEKVVNEISSIAENSERLIELHEEDPETAKIILEKYFSGESLEEYKARTEYKEDLSNTKIYNAKILKEATKIAETNKIEAEKQIFIKKLKMSDEEKESFEEALNERVQLKSFSINNLEKHFEKAYRDVNDNPEALKKIKEQEVIAKAMATGDGKGTSKGENASDVKAKKNSDYNKNFLKERGIL